MPITTILKNINWVATLPAGVVLLIIDIVSLWVISEKRGEQGWAVLIPFYRDYVFSKVAKVPKTGKRIITSKILIMLFAPALILCFVAIFVGGRKYWNEETGMMSYQPNYPAWAIIMSILLAVAIIVMCILIIIWYLKIYFRFIVINRAPGWMILVLIFLRPIALLYFAFMRGTGADPFPPQIHDDI